MPTLVSANLQKGRSQYWHYSFMIRQKDVGRLKLEKVVIRINGIYSTNLSSERTVANLKLENEK